MSDRDSIIELRERVRWYAKMRWFYLSLLALAGLVPLYLKNGWTTDFQHQLLIALSGVLLNIIVLLGTKERGHRRLFYFLLALAQISFDIFLVTWLLYQNGGIESRSIILYAVPILMTGALLSRFAIYVTTSAVILTYDILISLDHFGLIQPPNAAFAFAHRDVFFYVSSMFFYGAVFVTLAIISDYVGRLIRERERLNEEMHALNAEKAETEAILKSMGSALVAVDRNGSITMVNDSFTRLTGWKRQEAVGRQYNEVLPMVDEYGKRVGLADRPMQRLLEAPATSRKLARQLSGYGYVRKDGSSFPFLGFLAPIVSGDHVIGSTAVFDDATDIKKIQQLKSNFVALVSHQLKTPIGEIQGYIDNMLLGLTGELTPKQLETLKSVQEIVLRSGKLVSDLLDITVLEHNEAAVSLQPVEIAGIIARVEHVYGDRIAKTGLKVVVHQEDPKLTAIADGDMLVEVISNVLANAISYSRKGTITIRAAAEADTAKLYVSDQGRGMDRATLEAIFEKDEVLSGAPTAEGGTGLGLYLAKQLINLQNGSIAVEKTSRTGTTICITLPLMKR